MDKANLLRSTLLALTLGAGLAALTPWRPASAAAGDECIKVLGFEWSAETQTMDAGKAMHGDSAYWVFHTYNRLVDVDDNFTVLPDLAESWSISDDGKTWTFKLRQGVKFHSGKEFTSADVVYTFRRLLDPAFGSIVRDQLKFLKPEGIQAVDAHTVAFTSDEPAVELPVLITNKLTGIVPDGADAEALRLHEDGTGPYVQERFAPGGAITILRKDPAYWAPGIPKNECLRITVAQEALAAVASMKSGEVDVVLNVDPSVLGALQDDPNVALLQSGGGTALTFSMWVDTPPFDDVRVRQALKLAIDRQQMIDTVFLGYAEIGNDNPVPLSSPNAYTQAPPKRDVARARALLAEAGHPDGLSVDLYTSDAIPGMLKMAQAYAEMAKEAGIAINVVNAPADSYWDNIWLKKPFVVSAWSLRAPAEALTLGYTHDTPWPETHWNRPDYEAMLAKAKMTTDEAARRDLYKSLQKMLAEEGGVIIPLFVHQIAAVRAGCTGYAPPAISFNQRWEDIVCK